LIGEEVLQSLNPKIQIHKITSKVNITTDQPLNILSNLMLELDSFFDLAGKRRAILLGDRYETVGVALALNLRGIPFAHISGGESTPYSQDNKFRKCISILADFHFPPLLEHAKNLQALDIEDDKIFEVGYLGWDNSQTIHVIDPEYLQITEKYRTILVTFHPNSNDIYEIKREINVLLRSFELILAGCLDAYILITAANNDFGGNLINESFQFWAKGNVRTRFVQQLGQNYIEIMRRCNLVMGNSSSGIVEAPRIGVDILNIGNRQVGRSDSNIITHVGLDSKEISSIALHLLKKKVHAKKIKLPTGSTSVKSKIVRILIELLKSEKF
jgi:UDP-hydrolysing UDP-N-acetyl-D-glucosamine 2-epimerase